mgnify:FL=1|jgi:hypothetical protein
MSSVLGGSESHARHSTFDKNPRHAGERLMRMYSTQLPGAHFDVREDLRLHLFLLLEEFSPAHAR